MDLSPLHTTTMEYKRLLLIFKPTPDGDYILVNRPGLPLSPYCTALTRTSPVIDLPAALLSTLTAIIEEGNENGGVFGGYTFLLTRPANDGRHAIVILEKAVPVNHDKPVNATNIFNSNNNAHANADADWNFNSNSNANANDTHNKEDTTWSDSSPKVAIPGAWGDWDWGPQNKDQTRVRRTEVVKPDDTWSLDWNKPESTSADEKYYWSPRKKEEVQNNWGWDTPPVRSTSRYRNPTVGDWESDIGNSTVGEWGSVIGNVRDWAWTPSSTGSADDAAG